MIRRNDDAIDVGMSRRIFAGAGLATAGVLWTLGARALADRPPTAELAMGPFYPTIHPADADADLTWVKGRSARAAGQVIEVSGRVFDVHGNPLPDATSSCGRPMPRAVTTIRAIPRPRRSIRTSRVMQPCGRMRRARGGS